MDVPNSGAIFTLGKSYLAENTQSYFYIKNDPIKRLISGPHQSAVICESGRLFVWGENHYGQLGIGTQNAANNKANKNSNNTNETNANTNGNNNNSNNNNSEQNDIITKPTCVKSLKILGLKIADIAYGNNWAVILTQSNELFYTGRNIFDENAKIANKFTHTKILNEKCGIVRKPIRLDEFDNCLSNDEEAENFIAILAGNEHFAVMTSFGRLIGWGSNSSHQLGSQHEKNIANGNNSNAGIDDNDSIDSVNETILQPFEIKLDAPVRQFACGPESTLVLTHSGNLFLTGRLNDLVFTEFVVLQKNLSAAEQIIFMHISKSSEIFIVTNAGSIYRSSESVRTKSLIFQRFYDYDSEENGPIWKLLKGLSFFAVLTKANKFYTTFSESGHHLKTFREISKFKNLRLLDMTVGDKHILVHGIPRSSTLSATTGPGGEHRFMSRSFVMPTSILNGNANGNGNGGDNATKQNNSLENIKNSNEHYVEALKDTKTIPLDATMQRKETPKTNTPIQSPKLQMTLDEQSPEKRQNELKVDVDIEKEIIPSEVGSRENQSASANESNDTFDSSIETVIPKSPTESTKSRKSAHSIKFDTNSWDKSPSNDKLLRPRTPYPESSTNSTPQTIKKTPLRNYSYEAAMNNELLDRISPPILGASLENIPENMTDENATAPITAIVSSPTPPTEEDEQLTVEINTTTDALDHTIIVNEIRFINNGIDVTDNVKLNNAESDSELDLDDINNEDDMNDKSELSDTLKETTVEARKQAKGMLENLEQEIVERADQAVTFKNENVKEAKAKTSAVLDEIETKVKAAGNEVETTTNNIAQTTMDTVGENVKRVAHDAKHAVENLGEGAFKIASDARHTMDSALNKVANETKQAVETVTTKIGHEMSVAKDNLSTMLQPKKALREDNVEDEESCNIEESSGFKENNADDERTTASINSMHTNSVGGGNPFESSNPFESGNPFENDIDESLDKKKQLIQKKFIAREGEIVGHTKGRMRQFFDDVRAKSKGISCRNEKSIQIEDEPPVYTASDDKNKPTNFSNGRTNNPSSSQVCTIL